MRRRLYFQLIARFVMGGGIIGAILGIPCIAFWLLDSYGLLGLLFNSLIGIILGMLNGIQLGFIKLYIPMRRKSHQQSQLELSALIVTCIVSYILYLLIFTPVTPAIQITFVSACPPTIIATLIAWYASKKISMWQPANSSTEV